MKKVNLAKENLKIPYELMGIEDDKNCTQNVKVRDIDRSQTNTLWQLTLFQLDYLFFK